MKTAKQKSMMDAALLAMLRNPRRSFWISLALAVLLGAGSFAAGVLGANLIASETVLAIAGIWAFCTMIAPQPSERDIGGVAQMAFGGGIVCVAFAAAFAMAATHDPAEAKEIGLFIWAMLGAGALSIPCGIGYRATCRAQMLEG